MSIASLLHAWNDFFFKPQSPLPFAVYRIIYGFLMLILFCCQLAPDMEFWYSTNGILDHATAVRHFWHQPIFDLFYVIGDSLGGLQLFFALAICSAFFVTIGFGTRYSALILFMCMITVHYHQPWNLNGGDCFLRLAALFIALGHSGEMLSVDRWLKKKFHPEEVKDEYWPWAQRLFQIQICLVYWQTSVCKLSGDQWLDGTAVWYATRLDDMLHIDIPYLFDSLFMCKLLSWGTLVIEVALWTLVWVKECRYWVLLAGFALHAGIDIAISLPLFEWLFMAGLVTFVEPADLSYAFTQIKSLIKGELKLTTKLAAIPQWRRAAPTDTPV